jgi:LacI family transcriptional regulator
MIKQNKPSIKNVAIKAGVSPSTVSNYLNNSAPVNAITGARIEKAIQELGYIPNNIARSLRYGRTKDIGLVVTEIENSFYASLVNGMEEVASKNNYSIILACNIYDFEREKRQIYNLVSRGIAGIIFAAGSNMDFELINDLQRRKILIVAVDRKLPKVDIPTVAVDNFKAVYKGITYLINCGHRNIYYLTEPIIMDTLKDRFKGYKKALKDNGIEFNESKILLDKGLQTNIPKTSYEIMTNVIHEIEKPAAVFASSDYFTFGAIKAVFDNGLKVPDDISFMGFDNINLSPYIYPSLTTIKQPKKHMGRVAMQLMIDLIRGKKVKTKKILLETTLIIRDTVKKLV